MWQGWNIEVTKPPNYPSWEEVPPCPWLVASPTTHPGPHPHPTSSPSVPESLPLKSLIRDHRLIPIHCSPSWPLTPYSQNTLFLTHLLFVSCCSICAYVSFDRSPIPTYPCRVRGCFYSSSSLPRPPITLITAPLPLYLMISPGSKLSEMKMRTWVWKVEAVFKWRRSAV